MIVGVASVLALPWRRDASHVRKGGLADATKTTTGRRAHGRARASYESHRVTNQNGRVRRDAGHQTAPDQGLGMQPEAGRAVIFVAVALAGVLLAVLLTRALG